MAGAIPVRPSAPPSYQDHGQAPSHTVGSERAYSVYPASRGGSGGNPVPQSNPVPPSYGEHVGGNPVPRSNPVPPSYGEFVSGKSVPRSNPVAPSYGEHVGGNPAPGRNPVPPSYGQHVGGNTVPRSYPIPVPQSNPVPPSYEMYLGGNDDGDGVRGAPVAAAGTQGRKSDTGAVKVEQRRKKWAMFIAGNLISAAVVISEIAQLNVCFDEYVRDVDDDGIGSAELEEQIDYDASITNGVMMFTLVFGLWVEVFSASTLSIIYRSPLDIKSVHKIPSDDMRSCGGSVIVYFLAPFSWAMIYLFGGIASIYFAANSSCGGQGGSGTEIYLTLSGLIMTFGGLLMLALSVLILFCSCGSPSRHTDACCSAFRRNINKRILAKGPYLDIFWQLQGSVWSYRTGGFGLLTFIFVGSSGVLGEVLAAFGSLAPEIVQELVGPLA